MKLKLVLLIVLSTVLSSSVSFSQKFHLESQSQDLLHNFWISNNGSIYCTFIDNNIGREEKFIAKINETTKQVVWKKGYSYGDYISMGFFHENNGKDELYLSAIKITEDRSGRYPLICKFDADGALIWEKEFEDIEWTANMVILQADKYNDMFLVNRVKEDLEVFFIDPNGELLKEIHYTLKIDDGKELYSVNFINESEIYGQVIKTTGKLKEHFLVKFNESGQKKWSAKIVANERNHTFLNAQKIKDGILVYYQENNKTTIKFIDDKGNEKWVYTLDKFEKIKSVKVIKEDIHLLLEYFNKIRIRVLSTEGDLIKNLSIPETKLMSPIKFKCIDDKIYIGGGGMKSPDKSDILQNIGILKLDESYEYYDNNK